MAEPKKRKVETGELGVSGTIIQHGMIIDQDYNRDLIGRRALDAYERMRRSDATVRSSLQAIKLPIRAAEWYFDAASDDAKDVEVKEFVQACVRDVLNWDRFLEDALTYLEFGYSVFEMVFDVREIEGKYRQALVKLGFRRQSSIHYWKTTDDQPGVTQFLSTGESCSIPMAKLVVFTNQPEGDNYEGISVLRSSYMHWKIKSEVYKVDAVSFERHALGVLDITVPTGASADDELKVEQAANNLRANEKAYIKHPPGWLIDFKDMKAGSLREAKPLIDHHDRQISKNVLAQFLELGAQGGSGSRSLSEDMTRLFEQSEAAVARTIQDTINEVVIKTLVDLNFDVKQYPKIRVGKIGDDNLPVVSEAVKTFVEAGALTPSADDEQNVRKMIGWGPLEVGKDGKAVRPEATKPAKSDATKLDASQVISAARRSRDDLTGLLYGNAA